METVARSRPGAAGAVAARDPDRYDAAHLACQGVDLTRSGDARLAAQVHLLERHRYACWIGGGAAEA